MKYVFILFLGMQGILHAMERKNNSSRFIKKQESYHIDLSYQHDLVYPFKKNSKESFPPYLEWLRGQGIHAVQTQNFAKGVFALREYLSHAQELSYDLMGLASANFYLYKAYSEEEQFDDEKATFHQEESLKLFDEAALNGSIEAFVSIAELCCVQENYMYAIRSLELYTSFKKRNIYAFKIGILYVKLSQEKDEIDEKIKILEKAIESFQKIPSESRLKTKEIIFDIQKEILVLRAGGHGDED